MTQKWLPGPHPRVTPSDSKVTQKWLKNGVRSHFWVNFWSLWGRSARVTFESLLGHFNSFWVAAKLGVRWLHNTKNATALESIVFCNRWIRSRPGKPNQRKGQNEKFMIFAHFCEFWCFSLGKQAQFTYRTFCSGMPPRKVHELAFLWFGLPGPLLTEVFFYNPYRFSAPFPCENKHFWAPLLANRPSPYRATK